MEFDQRYNVALPAIDLWETLMDVHKVAGCLRGVEALNVVSDDRYEGRLGLKMGPVNLQFSGSVVVTSRDVENRKGVLEATARDPRAGGGFKASLTMTLAETGPEATDLTLNLNTTFLGRIGELGRPMIKKKIHTMMDDFVVELENQYATPAKQEP